MPAIDMNSKSPAQRGSLLTLLEKVAWRILARQEKKYRKQSKYHLADHIHASISVKNQKGCHMCCVLENTDWIAWAVRFDPVVAERVRTFDDIEESIQESKEDVVSLYL
jgi:hypothetical protein